MDPTKISILIATKNRAGDLHETLASLARMKVPRNFAVMVVVIDNGSSDLTRAVVREAERGPVEIRYIFEPAAGKNRCLNRGLRECDADIFMLTDDDVRVPEDWLHKMCRPLLDGQAEVVLGGIKMARHLWRPWMIDNILIWRDVLQNPPKGVRPSFIGANAGFTSNVLKSVPQFDEELDPGALGVAGDTLFGDQLVEGGFKFLSLIELTHVEHHFDGSRLSRNALIKRSYDQGRCDAYISYHWCHNEPSFVHLRLFYRTLRLWFLRFRLLLRSQPCEGLSLEESEAVLRVGLYHGLLIERTRSRQYVYRGLIKLNRPMKDPSRQQ